MEGSSLVNAILEDSTPIIDVWDDGPRWADWPEYSDWGEWSDNSSAADRD